MHPLQNARERKRDKYTHRMLTTVFSHTKNNSQNTVENCEGEGNVFYTP